MEDKWISRILAAVIVSVLCANGTVLGAIMTYEFDAGQSSVIQTGGIKGGRIEYAVEGRLEILVDCDLWTASLQNIQAGCVDGPDLDELFSMAELVCIDMNDTGIVFELPPSSEPVPRTAIRLSVLYYDNDQAVRISGGYSQQVADGFTYRLDATARAAGPPRPLDSSSAGSEASAASMEASAAPELPLDVIYVSVDGNDANDGLTEQTALRNIQTAIDTAPEGWGVLVLPGQYAENLDFKGRNLMVSGGTSVSFTSARQTTIQGNIQFRGTEDANCVLAAFTIDGSIAGYDPVIDPSGENHTHATISHCLIKNVTTGCGDLIVACDGLIENCVIADSTYLCERAYPVPAIVGCGGVFRNCTIVDVDDGFKVLDGQSCLIENCIIRCPLLAEQGGSMEIRYSDVIGMDSVIWGEEIIWGPGNIDADPCFAAEGDWENAGDYHLKSINGRWAKSTYTWYWQKDPVTSPCIDAGDPNSDWSREPWTHGQRINMGAYGGTTEASKSLSTVGCFPSSHPDYDEWVAVGMPACWCYPRQCYGDADGNWEGTIRCGIIMYVHYYDLNVLFAAWAVAEPPKGPGITTVEYNGIAGICADFAHDLEGGSKTGYFRVHFNDLNILVTHWNINDFRGPPMPTDCGGTYEP